MITTTDIDVISFCYKILKRKIKINEEQIFNGKYSFDVDLTEEELSDYFRSDYREFKTGIDDIKKKIKEKRYEI